MQTYNQPKGGHCRALPKCVDVKKIRDWMPDEAKKLIDVTSAWQIISRHFCGAVVARGVCPIDCERCKVEIVDLFRLGEAKSPKGLLTWLAKDHSARHIERLIAAEKEEGHFPAMESQDEFATLFPSRRGETNPFLDLLEFYEG